MASGIIGNDVPRKGLRVRVPCPPPPEPVFSLAFFVLWRGLEVGLGRAMLLNGRGRPFDDAWSNSRPRLLSTLDHRSND
jgi:hypothetical protein